MAQYIAAYDFGTSGVKIALVDFTGAVAGVSEKGYNLYYPKEGYVEQSPEEYWEAVCAVTRKALVISGVLPEEVVGLSFSVQSYNLIPVTAEGEILYPAVSWLDSRASKQAEKINEALGLPLVRSQDFQSRLLWFKEEMPDIYDRAAWFLDCAGFLHWKATGVMAVSEDHPGLAIQPDFLQEYLDATLGVAEVGKLAPMVEATKVYACLDKKGATELGLCEGTPVFGGCVDVVAAAAGAGCINEDEANVYLGSSGWLSVLVSSPADAAPGSYYLPSIKPGLVIYGGCINSCCMATNKVAALLYAEEKAMGKDYWSVINREVDLVPAGCEGLMATPWLRGEQFPVSDDNLRASFINLSSEHTRADMMAAMMESLCHSLRWQAELYEQDHGKKVQSVVANGGGSLSDPWMQMLANVMGCEVSVPEQRRHSGALGAAVAAGIGLGVCTPDDVSSLIHMERKYIPDPEKKDLYDRRYAMFKDLTAALQPFYDKYNGGMG